jgi:hypothetical protein
MSTRKCEAVEYQNRPWNLTDHTCRICLGRILETEGLFMCSACEAETSGVPDAICGCGIRVGESKRDGGFRCAPNPNRSPSNPSAVVIAFGGTRAVNMKE